MRQVLIIVLFLFGSCLSLTASRLDDSLSNAQAFRRLLKSGEYGKKDLLALDVLGDTLAHRAIKEGHLQSLHCLLSYMNQIGIDLRQVKSSRDRGLVDLAVRRGLIAPTAILYNYMPEEIEQKIAIAPGLPVDFLKRVQAKNTFIKNAEADAVALKSRTHKSAAPTIIFKPESIHSVLPGQQNSRDSYASPQPVAQIPNSGYSLFRDCLE